MSTGWRLSDVEQQEHRANLLRFRAALTVGILIWPLFMYVDYLNYRQAGRCDWGFILFLRALFWGYGTAILWVLHRRASVSPRLLRFFDISIFNMASVILAVISTQVGAWKSQYYVGIIQIVVARGAFVAEPWQKGVRANASIIFAWVGTLFVGALLDPGLAAQVRSRAFPDMFFPQFASVVSVALLVLVGSHAFWALRRQVFESRIIGRYRLKKRIGRGGMGEVWSAWHAALRRDVAVKILRPEANRDPASVERFEREVAAMTELSHPNTVRIFDYGVTEDGIWYYVMELLDGRDLGSLVSERGPLPVRRALKIGVQVARALAEAHDHGIVHRDIKPENIFVIRAGIEDDIAKVLDFGIARIAQTQPLETLTRTGAVVGTPAHISPEAARGAKVDARSDIYSLGTVLYFMLTGHPPFTKKNYAELLIAHIHTNAPLVSENGDGNAFPRLDRAVARCLAKDPAERFQTAGDLAEELEACLMEVQGEGRQ